MAFSPQPHLSKRNLDLQYLPRCLTCCCLLKMADPSSGAGASIPSEAMMHLSPLLQIPPIFEKLYEFLENFQNFTFSSQISRFFLVIDHKFSIPLIFPVSVHFPPLFRENFYFPPTLTNFPSVSCFFTYFMCISFPPYFDP